MVQSQMKNTSLLRGKSIKNVLHVYNQYVFLRMAFETCYNVLTIVRCRCRSTFEVLEHICNVCAWVFVCITCLQIHAIT